MWEIASVQCVQTLEGHTGVVMDLLCWDSFLLSCSLDGTVKASAKPTARFFGVCSHGVVAVVWSRSWVGRGGWAGLVIGVGVEMTDGACSGVFADLDFEYSRSAGADVHTPGGG